LIILVMGVAGCGKSTVGALLAKRLGATFIEADDFHSPENRAKMAAGVPLTDQDRTPWLQRLRQELVAGKGDHVIACSALKAAYRKILAADRIIYLKGSAALIAKRLAARKGHFFNPNLLESQLATLEEPANAMTFSIFETPEAIVAAAIKELGHGTH
jgi:gluconokinase